MSNVAISFASLVKSNNGFFKSEAQAKFLLGQCQDNVFSTMTLVYQNTCQMDYICDAKGIVEVVKHTRNRQTNNAKSVTTWTRQTNEAFEAAKLEAQARDQRNAAREAEANAKFQARQDAFANALQVAKDFITSQMKAEGVEEGRIVRTVNMLLNDQDDINALMSDLEQSPEFVAAWEAFNKM